MTSLNIQIIVADRERIGPGKIRLLELIRETGSISQAAQAMSMSYRRAWLLVKDINAIFSDALVATRAGARGGAVLTERGERFVAEYRSFEAQCLATLENGYPLLKPPRDET